MIIYIPFYLGEKYIERTLASVDRQTLKGVRVKILYQSGQLSYLEFIERFQRPGVEVLDASAATGIGSNWNFALRDPDPDPFLLILHQDDELDPQFCEAMVAELVDHPAWSLAYCDCLTIDADSQPIASPTNVIKGYFRPEVLDQDNVFWAMLLPIIPCPTVVYRRDELGGQMFREDLRNELDGEYWITALLRGKKIGYVAKRLYRYRRHGENESAINQNNLLKYKEIYQVFQEVKGKTPMAWALVGAFYVLLFLDLARTVSVRGSLLPRLKLLGLPFGLE